MLKYQVKTFHGWVNTWEGMYNCYPEHERRIVFVAQGEK